MKAKLRDPIRCGEQRLYLTHPSIPCKLRTRGYCSKLKAALNDYSNRYSSMPNEKPRWRSPSHAVMMRYLPGDLCHLVTPHEASIQRGSFGLTCLTRLTAS